MPGWLDGLSKSLENIKICCIPENKKNFDTLTPGANSRGATCGKADALSKPATATNIMSPKPRRSITSSTDVYLGLLQKAAKYGDVVLLAAVLKADLQSIQEKDSTGNTALHVAARNGHSEVCDLLCHVSQSLL